MSFIDDAKEATADIHDSLGEPVELFLESGERRTVQAVFDRDAIDVDGADVDYLAYNARLAGPTAELEFLTENQLVTIGDCRYCVVSNEPDRLGQSVCELARVLDQS